MTDAIQDSSTDHHRPQAAGVAESRLANIHT